MKERDGMRKVRTMMMRGINIHLEPGRSVPNC